MGWDRTLVLGDIGNQLDVEETELDIESLRQSIFRAYLLTDL